jgi:hypothetical protein
MDVLGVSDSGFKNFAGSSERMMWYVFDALEASENASDCGL